MTDDSKDSLLLFGAVALVVGALVGLATLLAVVSGCTPQIHGPAISLSTTVQAPCPCPSPAGAGPVGAVGPQ